ncbi:epoxide hydrolase family protein [Sphingomonas sp.]|uniref:epoxide hydrolase family protein n=1 Tax=Sphingomonas sp. TaxID=28214 RepID=UPI001B14BC4C|nr:epoxide hydrolase family protein [Sphingomonas sp.]MBO9711380.1 epoxide hydrolase [Sphingomonas sp.]
MNTRNARKLVGLLAATVAFYVPAQAFAAPGGETGHGAATAERSGTTATRHQPGASTPAIPLGADSATLGQPDDDSAIRPFSFHAPDEALADLRSRIRATKWPERETVSDPSQGVQLATLQKLAAYWGSKDYDWRKAEARLNALPQFTTRIDGLNIHFIHVRSKVKGALPVIITHGWPGSILEQIKIIDLLTNPMAHGGTEADAFDVIIPSLPGYGFSEKPGATGWDPQRVARAWVVLMQRLGYTRYVAQGGDWGNAVTEQMALLQPPGLIGIHTNMPATLPDAVSTALQFGQPAPAGLSAEEKAAWDQLDYFYKHGLGYAQEMANRPQTLYAIADSPVGLAAWMIDHDERSYELIARVFDGQPEGLTRDDILDNITLYWLTNTAVSSARLYWESKLAFFAPKGIQIPVALSIYPDELYSAPRSWAEKAYPKLIYYNRLPKGGHFAAWEQPDFFASELRNAFRSLR